MPGTLTFAMDVATQPDTSAAGPKSFIERYVATRSVDAVLEHVRQHGAAGELNLTLLTAPTGYVIRDLAVEMIVKAGEAAADMTLTLVRGDGSTAAIPVRVTSAEPARMVLGRFGAAADAAARRVSSIQISRDAGTGTPLTRLAAAIED